MAGLINVDFRMDKILVTLEVTSDEHQLIKYHREMLIVPTNALNDTLTTGKLGNSNRIMLPNKIMKKNSVESLKKKVPSTIVKARNGKYLVIQLEGPRTDIPEFK